MSDELLKRVVAVISQQLRTFDLIIRLGGDEFLCAMSKMTLPDARQRFSQVAATLAQAPDAGAIRIGFAELRPNENAAQLIAGADTGAEATAAMPARPTASVDDTRANVDRERE